MLLQVRGIVGQMSRSTRGSAGVIGITSWRGTRRGRGIAAGGPRCGQSAGHRAVRSDRDRAARRPRRRRHLPRLLRVTERRPTLLLLVCALVTLEAAAFLGLGVAWTTDVVRGTATLPGASLFLAAFGIGIALLLLLAARGLWRGPRGGGPPGALWPDPPLVPPVGGPRA